MSVVDPLHLWLLTTAADLGTSFSTLRPPGADIRLNMPIPEFPVSDLAEASLELIRGGLIQVRDGGRAHPDFALIASWINDRDWYGRGPWFRLTSAGGALWERECRAVWRKFLNNSMDRMEFDEDGERKRFRTTFEGSTRERVALYALAHRGGGFRCQSMKWKDLAPWKATYWKTLPRGVRLTCWFEKQDYNPCLEKAVRPLWDLGRWHQYPPHVYESGGRISSRPCGESLLRWP